jgi:hypothetical protein
MCTSCNGCIIFQRGQCCPHVIQELEKLFMNTRTRILALTLLIVAIALTACGGAQTAPGNGQPTLPVVGNGEGGGEAAGVEAALVTYSDSTQGFAIGYPGPWTQDTSFTSGVKFIGGDDYMTLEFVTGTDAMTYARRCCRCHSRIPGLQTN